MRVEVKKEENSVYVIVHTDSISKVYKEYPQVNQWLDSLAASLNRELGDKVFIVKGIRFRGVGEDNWVYIKIRTEEELMNRVVYDVMQKAEELRRELPYIEISFEV